MSTQATVQAHAKPAPVKRISFDVPLLIIVVTLVVFGLLMVYSASWDASLLIDKEPTYVFTRQLIWVCIGVVVCTAASLFDYHHYKKLVVIMMIVIMGLLFAVLIINEVRFSAARSLFSGSVQPAELAKMAIILYLAVWLDNRQETLANFKEGLLPLGIIVGLVAAFIIAQPDISASMTVVILGVMMFFLAGGDMRQIILILLGAGALGFLMITVMPTGKVRFAQYVSGMRNPREGSYHIRRTYEAVIKGRFFGVGLGNADTKFTGLPLPHTDSIFAVIAEETGVFGSFFVIILFVLLLWRGYVIAKNAPDNLGKLLSFGLIGWIVLEALMNIAVIVGLFPMAGNALPFISAGGSSMVTTLLAIGIVMNVSRQSAKNLSPERSSSNAAVDLRGRDWRRSVSRTNRYRDTE
jgi:cell division protein FtsW